MRYFCRKQEKFLEKLLFHLPELEKAVEDCRHRKEKEAEQSDDPTGRFAVLGLSAENMEVWLQVLDGELEKVREEEPFKYKIFMRRYLDKELPEITCRKKYISLSTYWRWRKELLLVVGLKAQEKNLKF